jgi:hypothetical protein
LKKNELTPGDDFLLEERPFQVLRAIAFRHDFKKPFSQFTTELPRIQTRCRILGHGIEGDKLNVTLSTD